MLCFGARPPLTPHRCRYILSRSNLAVVVSSEGMFFSCSRSSTDPVLRSACKPPRGASNNTRPEWGPSPASKPERNTRHS